MFAKKTVETVETLNVSELFTSQWLQTSRIKQHYTTLVNY